MSDPGAVPERPPPSPTAAAVDPSREESTAGRDAHLSHAERDILTRLGSP